LERQKKRIRRPVNSSPKELKRPDHVKLNTSQLKTLSQLMKGKTQSKKRKKLKPKMNTSKYKSFNEEKSISLYTNNNEVRIKDLLRESQYKREKYRNQYQPSENSLLDCSNNSLKNESNKFNEHSKVDKDLNLENVMKSSSFLRKDNSLNNSGFQNTPKKSKYFNVHSRSPDRLSIKASRIRKSESKPKINEQKLAKQKMLQRNKMFEMQKNVDLYKKLKTRSPEEISVVDAVNIYGKAFYTMNSVNSSKNNSRGSFKSGFGSRDRKQKILTSSSNLKILTSKNRKSKRTPKTRESYKVRSPKKISKKSQDRINFPKSKAKSRSNEPNKRKKQPQKITSKKRRKTNLFMKSRSRSMSSTSDVSPNRSRSLNKTNSELKKSGSFIEIDQHIGTVTYGYQIQESLGEGAYAKVYKALHINTKTPVAIKGKFRLKFSV
jgi:hypothetical protein